MKLSDLTNVPILSEGRIDPNALMALQSVASTGKFSNKFEELVLCKFSQLIKSGKFWQSTDPLFGIDTTVNVMFLAMLKALSPIDLKAFATYIYQTASSTNVEPINSESMSATDWINLYTAREAND